MTQPIILADCPYCAGRNPNCTPDSPTRKVHEGWDRGHEIQAGPTPEGYVGWRRRPWPRLSL